MSVILITGFSLAGVCIAAVFLARTISRPIIKVTNMLKDISEGEGDLTRRIDINSKNEIGSVLSANMNETAAAVNEITANIQSIKTRAIKQSSSGKRRKGICCGSGEIRKLAENSSE